MKIPPILYKDERLDEVNESITLIQKKDGLTFGTDAYLLAAFIRPSTRARAIELGAGTGIISLLLAARNKVHDTVSVEIQPEFAELCARNVTLNGFDGQIRTLQADAREIDSAHIGYEADLVFSNPPYMRTDSGLPNQVSKKNIARHETAGGIEDFCCAASRLLKYGGIFALVYRPDRLSELFSGLLRAGLEPKRMTFVHANAHTSPSMVLVESRKGGGKGLSVTPPLLLYKESGDPSSPEMTEDALLVYDTCSLYPPSDKSPRKKHLDKKE